VFVQHNSKSCRRISLKLFGQVGHATRNNWSHSVCHPDHNADIGIFKGIFLKLRYITRTMMICTSSEFSSLIDRGLRSPSYPLFTFVGDICRRHLLRTLLSPTNLGDKIFCRSPVSQNMPSGRVLGMWAWLTSIRLVVIDRPSRNVVPQFSEMSATFYYL